MIRKPAIARPLPSRTLWFAGAALAAFAICFTQISRVDAASAIALDADKGVYAYKVEGTLPEADAGVEALCREFGGENCAPIVSCAEAGFGAIATNQAGTFAGVCGAETQAMARQRALADCDEAVPADSACTILSEYHDDNAEGAVDLTFFQGNWRESCGDSTTYRFEAVSMRELGMSACSGTSEASCDKLKEVFSPGSSENELIYPTTGDKLIRRGPDRLAWQTVSNTQELRRCE